MFVPCLRKGDFYTLRIPNPLKIFCYYIMKAYLILTAALLILIFFAFQKLLFNGEYKASKVMPKAKQTQDLWLSAPAANANNANMSNPLQGNPHANK